MLVGLLWARLLGPEPAPEPPAAPVAEVVEARGAEPEPPLIPVAEAVDVRWSAPEPCPDRAGFVEAIEQLVGHRLRLSPDAAVVIDGRVTAAPGGLALRLELRAPRGTVVRELHGPRCEDLVEAGSVVVVAQLSSSAVAVTDAPRPRDSASSGPERSLAVDGARSSEAGASAEAGVVAEPGPAGEARPAAGGSERAVEGSAGAPGRPVEPRARAPERDFADSGPTRRSGPRGAVFVMGGGELGVTPRVTGAIRGGLALLVPRVRVELRAHHAFTTATPGTDGLRVRTALTRGEAVGCGVLGRGSIDVPLCAGLALGAAVGTAEGHLRNSRKRTQLWLGVPFEAGIGWAPLRWLALRATLGAVVSLRRPAFHVQADRGPLEPFRVPAMGGHVLCGVESRWP